MKFQVWLLGRNFCLLHDHQLGGGLGNVEVEKSAPSREHKLLKLYLHKTSLLKKQITISREKSQKHFYHINYFNYLQYFFIGEANSNIKREKSYKHFWLEKVFNQFEIYEKIVFAKKFSLPTYLGKLALTTTKTRFRSLR